MTIASPTSTPRPSCRTSGCRSSEALPARFRYRGATLKLDLCDQHQASFAKAAEERRAIYWNADRPYVSSATQSAPQDRLSPSRALSLAQFDAVCAYAAAIAGHGGAERGSASFSSAVAASIERAQDLYDAKADFSQGPAADFVWVMRQL